MGRERHRGTSAHQRLGQHLTSDEQVIDTAIRQVSTVLRGTGGYTSRVHPSGVKEEAEASRRRRGTDDCLGRKSSDCGKCGETEAVKKERNQKEMWLSRIKRGYFVGDGISRKRHF